MPEQNQVQKIHKLLSHYNTAMLVTHSDGDHLRARPMAIAQLEANCDLWFFTGRESAKAHEIEHDQRVLVVCQADRRSYLSIGGSATLIADRAKIRELWKDIYKAWFPGGVDDPTLTLIHMQAEQAEYWDSEGVNGIQYAFEVAKAYASGTRPKVIEGEQHGTTGLKAA